MNKDILWVEQYRPSTIDDLILPEEVKINFQNEYSSTHKITDKTTENGRAIFIMNKLFAGKVIQRPEFVGSTINKFFDNE